MSAPLKIFIIYAREDRGYKDDLLKSLKLLQTQGLIEPWHDSDIKPGDEWDKEIKAHLRAADIILPIISFDFFDSDYIHRVEIVEAFERYDRGEALIIPIIADSCPWTDYLRLKDFQALPTDGKPIDDWPDRKKAMSSIYEGVKEMIFRKKRESALRYFELGLNAESPYEQIDYYTKAIQTSPDYAFAYNNRGVSNTHLLQYNEAIIDFDLAIQLDPNDVFAYLNRGTAREELGFLDKAYSDFEKVLSLDPENLYAINSLKRLKEKIN